MCELRVRLSDVCGGGGRIEAEPQDGDAQDEVAAEGHLVLPQGVVHRVEREGVVATVDLDDQADVLPRDVEVHPPPRARPNNLTAGRR